MPTAAFLTVGLLMIGILEPKERFTIDFFGDFRLLTFAAFLLACFFGAAFLRFGADLFFFLAALALLNLINFLVAALCFAVLRAIFYLTKLFYKGF